MRKQVCDQSSHHFISDHLPPPVNKKLTSFHLIVATHKFSKPLDHPLPDFCSYQRNTTDLD